MPAVCMCVAPEWLAAVVHAGACIMAHCSHVLHVLSSSTFGRSAAFGGRGWVLGQATASRGMQSVCPSRKSTKPLQPLQPLCPPLPPKQIDSLEGRGKYGSFLRAITQFYLQYHTWVHGSSTL